jgi:probable rRNA maturation factor
MERLLTVLLRRERANGNVEVSVLFCDDLVIHALNREYRRIDRPTDVLSFSLQDGDSEMLPPAREHEPLALGDLVISLETAARQAQAQGHSLAREVEWLLLHGMLHLLGYDDTTDDGLQDMIARQRAVLDELAAPGAPDPTIRQIPDP